VRGWILELQLDREYEEVADFACLKYSIATIIIHLGGKILLVIILNQKLLNVLMYLKPITFSIPSIDPPQFLIPALISPL